MLQWKLRGLLSIRPPAASWSLSWKAKWDFSSSNTVCDVNIFTGGGSAEAWCSIVGEEKLVIKGGHVVYDGRVVRADIEISSGVVSRVARSIGGEPSVDASGMIIMPCSIDVHVHFRGLKQSSKETVETGSRAACAGGVTAVLDMPNTDPPLDTVEVLLAKVSEARGRCYTDYTLAAGYSGDLGELEKLLSIGLPAVKLYVHELGEDRREVADIIREAALACARHGALLMIHPEARWLLREGEAESPEEYCKLRPLEAELEAIRAVAEAITPLAETPRVHLCHLTSAKSVSEALKLREQGIPVSTEVTPHHLLLSLEQAGAECKVNPPLRSIAEVKGLQEALAGGLVDVIASDHAPHEAEKKKAFKDSPPGLPGVELTLVLVLDWALKQGISPVEVAKWASKKPARLLGIRDKGEIAEGMEADIVALSRGEYRIEEKSLYTKAKYTPFAERTVSVRVEMVFKRGAMVFERDVGVLEKPLGRLLLWDGEKLRPASWSLEKPSTSSQQPP
ncbi:MAG: hypothetical protein DRN96_07035 [Thermoproteota archaeon]|nr:MAG: hypothetical protein DRN96_07035 [Candidatus Korarchaeota archaeon]